MMTIACVFPGQGSQKVGMLDAFAAQHEVAGRLAAADAGRGEPRPAVLANWPAEDLALTVNTQPALLLAGYACYLAWRAAGGPAAGLVAGHSLGEYTALFAAGAIEPA